MAVESNMKVKLPTGEIDLLAPSCEPGKCRSNCRKNPNCFFQLGEKFWFHEIKERYWVAANVSDERKKTGHHVGLKNLGATCYVNTFLQLWFHNEAFRSFVYQWKPTHEICAVEQENGENCPKSLLLDFGDNPTDSICGNLQYLFSLMQHSERRFVDPSSFVKSLGLQTDEQQDAQEFSKLFVSLLGDALSEQVKSGQNIIDHQFGGNYIYQTKCNVCHSTSETLSNFSEIDLNIKGHVKLKECMKEFLMEEILDGDNKYFCSACQCKQSATRKIVLQTLPPILNLQLLRFVFERETGSKKKLNSVIYFPEILDMNEYKTFDDPEDGIYLLTAVLIHMGLSAHSGHYIAHIYDQKNEVWCRFNDEEVGHIKGKTLQLGKEEDLEGCLGEKTKKSRKIEGQISSKNAYMLVYQKKKSSNVTHDINLPGNMVEFVARDNSLFEQWFDELKVKQDEALSKGKEKQNTIQSIYASLPVKEDGEFEWISTAWLKQWLNHDITVTPPIDNTCLMCRHSRADPAKITSMKRISVEAAERLFVHYGGLPRLKSDALCNSCIDYMNRKQVFELKLNEDVKEFSKLLKVSYKNSSSGFWVGKKSLKRFKQLAIKKFLEDEEISETNSSFIQPSQEASNDQNNNDSLNEDDEEISQSRNENVNGESTAIAGKVDQSQFNDDLLCSEHGNLSVKPESRVLVSSKLWQRFCDYFGSVNAYSKDSEVCRLCIDKRQTCAEEEQTMKFLVNEQKETLSFLNNFSTEKLKEILAKDQFTLHVVLASFVKNWKRSLRSKKFLTAVDNTEIICEHDRLLYTAEEILYEALKEDPLLHLISSEQLACLQEFFTFTNAVTLQRKQDGNICTSRPDFCPGCRDNRLFEEAHDSKQYSSAYIYIRKKVISKSTTADTPLYPSNDQDNDDELKPCKDENEDELVKPYGLNLVIRGEKRDSDFPSPMAVKKLKHTPVHDSDRRRSTRHRAKRGEERVKVHSNQTLRELKLQLLHIFAVLPVEQTLVFENGDVIENDDMLLFELGITPETNLTLQVDEPASEPSLIEENTSGKPRALEEGFKGTNLYGTKSLAVKI